MLDLNEELSSLGYGNIWSPFEVAVKAETDRERINARLRERYWLDQRTACKKQREWYSANASKEVARVTAWKKRKRQDPAFVAKEKAYLAAYYQRPEVKAKQKARDVIRYADPAYRAKRAAQRKAKRTR